jgi:virginiamycin B lyase
MKRRSLVIFLIVLTIGLGALSSTQLLKQPFSRSTNLSSTISRSNLSEDGFGAIRKYKLPPGRSPNAIAVASDGSVWFGEQTLPGIARLYLNGSLVEYKWPFQYPAPFHSTFIWGITIWNGCIWASDEAASQLVAVNPDTGAVRTFKLAEGSFPYTLTIGPHNSLWFTEIFASKIGYVDERLQLHEYSVAAATPAEIVFANDSLGYFVDTGNVGLVKPAIFSFDPNDFSPTKIASEDNLLSPTSLALSGGGVWLTQHASSNLAYYDLEGHGWSFYPTSRVSYQKITLPYFVAANGTLVWFNEHYGNRMARVDTARGLLTEYSLSNPASSRITGIDNALTFSLDNNRVWFTELTGNSVGYVDASYEPNFHISVTSSTIKLKAGQRVNVTFAVQGQSGSPLTVKFADSESYTSEPKEIILNTTTMEIPQLSGQKELLVSIMADQAIPPGDYTLLVTVTDGLVNQGVYLRLQVST